MNEFTSSGAQLDVLDAGAGGTAVVQHSDNQPHHNKHVTLVQYRYE